VAASFPDGTRGLEDRCAVWMALPGCHVFGYPNGRVDVAQFAEEAAQWEPGDATATLTGRLYDETQTQEGDDICKLP
jgi:hypothetical protein